jgi:recombination protein RecA
LNPARTFPKSCEDPATGTQVLEFTGVFRGREITAKSRRLSSGIAPLDALLRGGIVRSRISEFIGQVSSGRTSLAAALAAAATRRGEEVGWIDSADAFDPASMAAGGVDLARVLWVSVRNATAARHLQGNSRTRLVTRSSALLKAAELVLDAGGFGLVVIDFGDLKYPIPQSAALRLARVAERSGAAVVALAIRRICGTFAALSLVMHRVEASFSRLGAAAPMIFDGLRLEAAVARNKLGGSGQRVIVQALADPAGQLALPFTEAANDRAAATTKPCNRA